MHCRSATAVYCWCDWRGSNSHVNLTAELKSAASANSATIAFGVAAGDRTQRKACLRRSRMPIPPRQHMEQVMVIETTSSDWKSDILTVRRYLHISRGDESREVRLPCQAVCVSGVCSRTYNFLRTVRIGRGDRIRTCGISLPKRVLYQAEPHLVIARRPDLNRRPLA